MNNNLEELIEAWVNTENNIRKLKDELHEFNHLKEELDKQLTETLAENGIQSVSTDRGTIYLQTVTYVSRRKGTDPQDLVTWLNANDCSEVVNTAPQASRLKSLVTEYMMSDNGGVPDELEQMLNISQIRVPRLRRS